jgi:hypothetical protein
MEKMPRIVDIVLGGQTDEGVHTLFKGNRRS